MNLKMLAALPNLRNTEPAAFRDDLTRLLRENMTDEPVTIKGARDRFSEINRRAREGHVQVVKGTSGQETVLLSMTDLAALLQASATEVSFADALKSSGFSPVRQQRLVLAEGMESETELVLRKKELKAETMLTAGAL